MMESEKLTKEIIENNEEVSIDNIDTAILTATDVQAEELIDYLVNEEVSDDENSEENDNQERYLSDVSTKERRELYIKAQNVIKNAKIEKYIVDRDLIASEKLTFWGVITGKNALQLQRIENVKLKIELLQTQKVVEKDNYEAIDVLSDLYACAISELNGKFTPEMTSLYNKIKEKYRDAAEISDEEVYQAVCSKVDKSHSYLPEIHNEGERGIFGDIKVQVRYFKLENQKLKNQIVIERGRSQFLTFKQNNTVNPKIVPLQ